MSVGMVLLIEDDRGFRQTLRRYLLKRDFSVIECDESGAAISMATVHQPSHILLDLVLGKTSTLKLIPELLQAAPATRIIVLTGCTRIALAVNAIKLGAEDFLTKPVDGKVIVAALLGERESGVVAFEGERMPLENLEWLHISRVLDQNKQNISKTASALNMDRRTLQRKLDKYSPESRGGSRRQPLRSANAVLKCNTG